MASEGVINGYKLLTSVSIDSTNDRNSSIGKLLKSTFILGPSVPVDKHGKVEIIGTHMERESYAHYSMLNACCALKHVYEADKDTDASDNKSDTSLFVGDTDFTVRCLLPNEGFTLWTIVVNNESIDVLNDIKSLVESGEFKNAYLLASKQSKTDGLVPIRCETYINPKAKCQCPFIGNCRFSCDSGSADNDSSEDVTLSLGVAPIDAKTKKTSENSIMMLNYNVVGNIIGNAQVNAVMNAIGKSDNDEDDKANELSKFISHKFKNTGDQTMYKDFVKIRDFIAQQIAANNLELNETSSDGPLDFVKFSGNKNKLFYY